MQYDHFEFVMMQFKLVNAFAIFMDLINRVFYDCSNKFVMISIDDIQVYSKSHKKHKQHLRFFRDKQLYAKFRKYEFWHDRAAFLGYVILIKGISVDPSKIEVVLDWQRSKTIKKIHIFFGLAGYYKRFVKVFFQASESSHSSHKEGNSIPIVQCM